MAPNFRALTGFSSTIRLELACSFLKFSWPSRLRLPVPRRWPSRRAEPARPRVGGSPKQVLPHPVVARVALRPVEVAKRAAKAADSPKQPPRKAPSPVAVHPAAVVNRAAKPAVDKPKPVQLHPVAAVNRATQVAAVKPNPAVTRQRDKAAGRPRRAVRPQAIRPAALHPLVAVNRALQAVPDSPKPEAVSPKRVVSPPLANPVAPVLLAFQAALVEPVNPKRVGVNPAVNPPRHRGLPKAAGQAVAASKSRVRAKAVATRARAQVVEQPALDKLAVRPTAKVVRASPSSP